MHIQNRSLMYITLVNYQKTPLLLQIEDHVNILIKIRPISTTPAIFVCTTIMLGIQSQPKVIHI